MKKLVNKENNTVNYGIYDELIDFNWNDYQLRNFWGKKYSKFKQKRIFHSFHFVSFTNDECVVGLAFVCLGFAKNIFGYVYQKDKGLIANWQAPLLNSQLQYGENLDNHQISRKSKSININIQKNLDKKIIVGKYQYKKIISIEYEIQLGLEQVPLRVVNPADFERWVFTEKRAGLPLKKLNIHINGQKLDMDISNTLASVDYSGGYFKRDTNWIWGNGCTKIANDTIGFNFAVFNNDALYPENAVWVNNEREHYERVLFKWNYDNTKEGLEIYTTDNRLHLYFEPLGQKNDIRSHVFGLIKTNFRQFFGYYHGHVSVNGTKIELKKFLGFAEIHKALW